MTAKHKSCIESETDFWYTVFINMKGGAAMLCDILKSEKIEYFSAINFDLCRPGNLRLYSKIPKDTYVVFMLFPYYVEKTDPALSKFAAVYDYHGFAKTVFEKCETYLGKKYPDRFFKGYTDHSPFAEGHGACCANLGIKGTNGLLINEKYGSFVCIGEIVCALSPQELSAEGIPLGDGKLKSCENCGSCVSSCPGGCCGTCNRDGCISEITQKKKELSEEEISAMCRAGYIWGCDECSLCCSHASFRETPIDYFRKSAIEKDAPRVIASMSDEEFAKYPFSWRKRDIILRNCRILYGENKKENENG